MALRREVKQLKEELRKHKWSVEKISDNDSATSFYTGLPTFAVFVWLFQYLEKYFNFYIKNAIIVKKKETVFLSNVLIRTNLCFGKILNTNGRVQLSIDQYNDLEKMINVLKPFYQTLPLDHWYELHNTNDVFKPIKLYNCKVIFYNTNDVFKPIKHTEDIYKLSNVLGQSLVKFQFCTVKINRGSNNDKLISKSKRDNRWSWRIHWPKIGGLEQGQNYLGLSRT
ncbi:hypothetical protein KUTeg_021341 [Tegillarca granosa]|uniref:Homing endonuclease LAGLIDADG domain-containing protein n=1 Tax=Tegillarca granosa TaxID=220873 RepID=A0ABQ9ECS3_TEGGR|nr:hypothetical protein KUTeg_021341 [Tegillarca granosa]